MILNPIICPRGLEGDSGWRAALHVLNCDLLLAKGVDQFVDVERRSIYFRKLLRAARPWSSGERMMVQVAASLFSPEFKTPNLWELAGRLDSDNVALVAEAIRVAAGLDKSPWSVRGA